MLATSGLRRMDMSYLKDKIEELRRHNIILVTGPQRSGTQIASRILAHELEYAYVDEGRFNVWDVEEAVRQADRHRPCVIQGPGLLRKVKDFRDIWYESYKDNSANSGPTAVLMRRSSQDISKSLHKIPATLERLRIEWPEISRAPLLPSGCLPVIMYFFWDVAIVGKYGKTYEIEYDLLAEHEFWVSKEERRTWKVKQWKK